MKGLEEMENEMSQQSVRAASLSNKIHSDKRIK